jgi:hypothetical protein
MESSNFRSGAAACSQLDAALAAPVMHRRESKVHTSSGMAWRNSESGFGWR